MIGSPVDVLHGEVRPPVGGDAAVEEARDVGVLQPRENLPLAEEAAENLAAEWPAANELERDVLLELAVGAIGQEHPAHAAVADLADHAVRPDAVAGLFPFLGLDLRRRGVDQARGVDHRRRLEELLRVGVGGDESLDLRAEHGVAGARAIEHRGAGRRLEVQHLVQDRLDAGPFLRREGVRHDWLATRRSWIS